MKKITPIIVIVLLAMASCHRPKNVSEQVFVQTRSNEIESDTAFLHAVDELKKDKNSLVYPTSDTILSVNPELVVLLDPLYQRVRNDSMQKTVQSEEKWMSNLRAKLSDYYDAYHLGSDTLSVYEKADSVMNVAERLYEIDDDWTTYGMIVRNSIYYTFNVFREYNLLSQMIACCDDDETKTLIYQEWTLYEKMFKQMGEISTNLVCLNNWGGSIVGPLSTVNYLILSNNRRGVYSELINLCKGKDYSTMNGVYFDHAENLLFDSLHKAVKDAVKKEKDVRDELGKADDDDFSRYMETAKEAESTMMKMRPLVKEWIELWEKLDEKLTTDGSRHHAERIASAMLLQWTSVASEQ